MLETMQLFSHLFHLARDELFIRLEVENASNSDEFIDLIDT